MYLDMYYIQIMSQHNFNSLNNYLYVRYIIMLEI